MKAFLQALVFVVFMPALFSCISSNEKSEDIKRKELLAAIEQAEQSEQIENELFLGFKFGMAEKEVEKHLDQLMKEGKIYINNVGEYQYDLHDKYGSKFYITFVPHYHEGLLYEMVYPIERASISTGNDHIPVASFFKSSDEENKYEWYITENPFNGPIYTFVKNNLIVTFNNTGRSLMKYTNAPVNKMASDLEELEREKKAKESSSEF